MRHAAFYTAILGSLLAALPLSAQSTADSAAAPKEEAEVRSGVRFVVCSTSGNPLPGTLYYQTKKDEFKAIRIAGRTPSPRIKPFNGNTVKFWDKDPSVEAEENATDKPNRAADAKVELPKPALEIEVPAGTPSRSLCIIVPRQDGKPATYFIAESDIPAKGMHVINMTPWPAFMTISPKGDFSDKPKSQLIKPANLKSRGFGRDSIWSYRGDNNENGVAFLLEYQPDRATPDRRRIRSSRFVVSDRQAQITILVKDGNNVRMVNIQLADDRRRAPRR